MPINYQDYHPQWKLISEYIRFDRAHNRCERCGLLNGSLIVRLPRGHREPTSEELDMLDYLTGLGWKRKKALKWLGITQVVLTVAHLDRNPQNNAYFNLMAACQKCHLGYDMLQNQTNRRFGKHYRRTQYELFNDLIRHGLSPE